MGVAAAAAGKDIYLEKPMTYSIAEGQKLVSAVRKNGRILQVGSHQRSSVHFLIACELVRNGRLGKLRTIRVTLPEDQGAGDPRPTPVPKNLDYDFWAGPATPASFCEDRVHPQTSYERPGWLQTESNCLGMITGWGTHMVDSAQWGHGTDGTGPISVEARAEFPDRGSFNVHTKFQAEAVYADGIRMIMETGDPAGVRFEGDAGWVFVQRGVLKASEPGILRWKPGQGAVKLEESGNHMKNFLEAMRSRKDPVAPVEVGHRSNSICVMTHIAMKLGRKLAWIRPPNASWAMTKPIAAWITRTGRHGSCEGRGRIPARRSEAEGSPGAAPALRLGLCGLGSFRRGMRGPAIDRTLRPDDSAGRLSIFIGGREALIYQFSDSLDLPHYWPLRSPSGKNLLIQKTEPYPHHRAFWFADTVRPEGEREVSLYNALYSGLKDRREVGGERRPADSDIRSSIPRKNPAQVLLPDGSPRPVGRRRGGTRLGNGRRPADPR